MDHGHHNAPQVSASLAAVVVSIVIFLLPLALDPGGLFPFGPVKWMVASAGVLAATALLFRHGEIRVHRASSIGWAAFLSWAAISAWFGLDPVHAWIGTPDRHLGLVALLLFVLAFLIGQNLGNERSLLVRASSLGLGGIGIYGAAELLGFAPVALVSTSNRVGGPLGSPAYLGAACALLIPMSIGLSFDPDQPKRWRIVATIAAALGFIALVASQTRAAVIGLAVGVALLVPLARRRLVVGIGVVLLIGATFLTPAGRRLAEVTDLTSPEARGRLDEWRIGLKAIGSYPLLGAGLEGYRIAFPAVVDVEYERRHGREVAPDRAHNGVLDSAIALGVPGAMFYVLAGGWLLIRVLRAMGDPVLVGVGAGVAAYLAQQQFLFPLAEVDPIFWVMAGLLVAATDRGDPVIHWRASRVVSRVCVVLSLAAASLGALEMIADRRAAESYRLVGVGDFTEAVVAADKAAALRPDSIRYWFIAADIASRAGDAGALADALARIERALDISPADPILVATRSRLLLDRAQVTASPSDLDLALKALSELIVGDPNNASHRLLMGVAQVLNGDPNGAEGEWVLAQSLAPSSPVPSMNLARLYLSQERPEDASAAFLQALAIDPSAPGLAALANLLSGAGVEVPLP